LIHFYKRTFIMNLSVPWQQDFVPQGPDLPNEYSVQEDSGHSGGEGEIVSLVLMEMFLSFAGILLNLLVVTTVRHHEDLMTSTTNLLLLNLCFSNLLISFLVKPISAIYGAYSISTGTWQVSLVFCSMYTLIYRTTWCILPFTVLSLSWLYIIPSCAKDKSGLREEPIGSIPQSPSTSSRESPVSSTPSPYYPGTLSPVPAPLSPDTKRRLAELSDDISMSQKLMLLSIWLCAAFFGIATCFPEKVFGVGMLQGSDIQIVSELVGSAREEELTSCRIRTGINDFLDYISLTVTFLIPTILGPVLLTLISPLIILKSRGEVPPPLLLVGLTITFVFSYLLHMVISEALIFDRFTFLVTKNLVGFLFLVFVPVIVIANQTDIRNGLRPIFRSKIICPPASEEEGEEEED